MMSVAILSLSKQAMMCIASIVIQTYLKRLDNIPAKLDENKFTTQFHTHSESYR